ncbi:MAG: hypothetical protein HDS66_04910 [Bacteroidales bacterium]|nr:hypothetical protein [Bacteroidales bacterium]
MSKEYFKVIGTEDAAVADFATFAGGKYFFIPPTSVKIVSQGDTISEFKYRAVRFPNGNIDKVTAVEHSASHQEKTMLSGEVKIPGDAVR